MTRRAGGFSLVEVLIAMAVMVTFTGALMSLILAGETIARMQPEAADVQQRARIVLQTLGAELALAGAGLDSGPQAGPLSRYFAPIGPSSDGGVTIWYVSNREAQTTLAAPLVPGSTDAPILNAPDCPLSDPVCAFVPTSTALSSTIADAATCCIDAVTPPRCRCVGWACAYARARGPKGESCYRVDPPRGRLRAATKRRALSVPVLDSVGADHPVLDAGRLVRLTIRIAAIQPARADLELSRRQAAESQEP